MRVINSEITTLETAFVFSRVRGNKSCGRFKNNSRNVFVRNSENALPPSTFHYSCTCEQLVTTHGASKLHFKLKISFGNAFSENIFPFSELIFRNERCEGENPRLTSIKRPQPGTFTMLGRHEQQMAVVKENIEEIFTRAAACNSQERKRQK